MNVGRNFGLIAGNGRFPFLVLEGARREGVEMAVAAIKEETHPEIEKLARVVEWISVGHLNKLIKFFQREGVAAEEKAIAGCTGRPAVQYPSACRQHALRIACVHRASRPAHPSRTTE